MTDSWFADVELAPPIEVFALTASYNDDAHPNKVNLGVGAYRTDEGVPWVLPVVRTVEQQMATDLTLNHEYLPVAGNPTFRTNCQKLLLGGNSPVFTENRLIRVFSRTKVSVIRTRERRDRANVVLQHQSLLPRLKLQSSFNCIQVDSIQAHGGTGALFIAMNFLRTRLKFDTIYVSNPTWGNQKTIAKGLEYPYIKEYRYWNESNRSLDLEGMLDDLRNAPKNSVVVLHACAHNPTGVDPTEDQWKQIAEVIRECRLFPLFDCAYQGFASGDLEKDARAVRYFVEQGFEIFVAQSFSKNFGLYNERVGNLVFVSSTSESVAQLRSQLMIVVRGTWSNSSNHGSRIVATILDNPALRNEWVEHVKSMADRIKLMRQKLFDKLRALGTPGNWEHVTNQNGMFSYTGLNVAQVKHLQDAYHIYLVKSGRINMCALTTKNLDYVANAIHDAVSNVSTDTAKL